LQKNTHMNYIKNIRNAALYSPYEIKVRDLTSNDPFAGNAQKARKEVAEATNNYESFLMTMRVLWERMSDTGKNWRHVYKGLQLLEYLLVYGHENVVHDAKNNLGKIKILKSFSYVDEQTFNDYGEGVRRLAERVLGTLSDDKKLDEYRDLAEKGQFQGFPKLTEPSSYAQKKGESKPRRRDDSDDDEPVRKPKQRYDEHEEDRPRRKMTPVGRKHDDSDDEQEQRRPQRRYDSEDEEEKPRESPKRRSYNDYEEQPRQRPDSARTPQDRPNQSGLDFYFDDEVEIAFNQNSRPQQQPRPQEQPRQQLPPPPKQVKQPQQQPQLLFEDEQPVADSRGSRDELEYTKSELQRVLRENENLKVELADTKRRYEELWQSLESK
jgi:hypothetical protein